VHFRCASETGRKFKVLVSDALCQKRRAGVGDRATEHPGGLVVDDRLVRGQRLDRKVGRDLGLGTAAAVYPPFEGRSARFRTIQI